MTFKEIKEKFRIKRYYKIKANNGMGFLASILDKLIFRSIIFLVIFIYIKSIIKSISMSISLIFMIITVYTLLAYKINNKRLKEGIKIINKNLIIEKIYRKLMNKSTDSYVEYMKEILLNFGVTDMRNTLSKDLDIVGIKNGGEIGIKCYQYSEEHDVDENDIKNFFIDIRDNDINRGIILTTSSFSDEARTFFENIEYVSVIFLTIEDIIEIIKETSLYPSERDIEEMILKELDNKRIKVKNEGKKIISKDNTKSCIIAGIVIILFSKVTIFTTYYKIFGSLLIILGIVPLIKTLVSLILSENTEEI